MKTAGGVAEVGILASLATISAMPGVDGSSVLTGKDAVLSGRPSTTLSTMDLSASALVSVADMAGVAKAITHDRCSSGEDAVGRPGNGITKDASQASRRFLSLM